MKTQINYKDMKTIIRLASAIIMLTIGAINAWGINAPAYTFATAQNGTNNSYGSTYDVTINGKDWNVPGNQNFDGFLRIGGKSLSGVDRIITGKSTLADAITKITLNHNGRSNDNFTVNSITVTVASNSTFTSIIDTKTVSSPSISTSTEGSIDFTPTSPLTEWDEDSYYKITFNVSNSDNSNYGLDVTSIVFYKDVPAHTVTWISHGEDFDVTEAAEGYKPSFPESTPTSCDLTSSTFIGWTQTTWSGKTDDISDKTTDATKVYTGASQFPVITGDITYHAVFAKVVDGRTIVFEDDMNISGSAAVESRDGWESFSTAYAAGGSIRLSSKDYMGEMVTDALTGLPSSATISFKAKAWSETENEVRLQANKGTFATSSFTTSTLGFETYSTTITGGDGTTQITFDGGEAGDRVFIKDIVIYYGEVDISQYLTTCHIYTNYRTSCFRTYNDASNDHMWSTAANWNGSRLPTIRERADILKPVTVDVTTAKAKSVVLKQNSGNTGHLEIAPGKELVVATTVRKTTDGSTLVATGVNDIEISSTSSVGLGALVMGTNDGTNKATVNFYTKSTGKKNENTSVGQYVGTPFNDETNILGNWYNSWVYSIYYPNGNIDWERVEEGSGMDPFKGYCVFSKDAWDNGGGHSYWQQGTLVSSDNHTCSSLNWQSGSGTANANNENLLANSWMAPIKIKAMQSSDFVNATATVYIFNSTSNSAYSSLAGNYTAHTVGTSEGVIPAMQSFSVFTTGSGASVSLDYNKIVYAPALAGTASPAVNSAPKRSGYTEDDADKMRLFVRTEDGCGDMLYMWERADFTEGFENGWDGQKIYGESYAPQLYAITPDGYMSVNCVPNWEGTVVGFRAGTEDNLYTFSFEYEGRNTWYLNDLKTEQSTRILSGNTYQFSTAEGDSEARFIISATPLGEVLTGVETSDIRNQKSDVRKLLIGGTLYIIRNGRMYDATGVMIK